MDFVLLRRLSFRKKIDSYPLEQEITHLLKFLKHFRADIKPVDPIEFLAIYSFYATYTAEDIQTLEKHYLIKIPPHLPKRITTVHRQFFEAILPFTGRDFKRGNAYTKTRGALVERLTLLILKCEEGVTGDHSLILLEAGKPYGKAIGINHEELDLVVYPQNEEMAIGESKFDGARYYKRDDLILWYEAAAERIEIEGIKRVHNFAVCATNPDVLTKHLQKMSLGRTWWIFSVSDYKNQWSVK